MMMMMMMMMIFPERVEHISLETSLQESPPSVPQA
jgi:hypothetical protein